MTIEKYKKIKKLLADGHTVQGVADMVGYGRHTVYYVKYDYYIIENDKVTASFAWNKYQRKLKQDKKNGIFHEKESMKDFYSKHSCKTELKTWDGNKNNIAVQLNDDYHTRYLDMRNRHLFPNLYKPL
jgi:hypothetical protein